MAAPDPLNELERAGADRLEIVRIVDHVSPLIKLLLNTCGAMRAKAVIGIQHFGVWCFQTDHEGMFIRGLHGFNDRCQTAGADTPVFQGYLLDAVCYILRGYGAPVMKGCSTLQMERIG